MYAKGFEHVARVLTLLPATADDICQKTGQLDRFAVEKILMGFERLAVVHISDVIHVGPRNYRRLFSFGPGVSKPTPYDFRARSKRISSAVRCVAGMVRMMLDGDVSVQEVVEEIGIHKTTVHGVLKVFRSADVARICRWEKVATEVIPHWSFGSAPDAKRPKPLSRKVVNQRAWARRKERLRAVQIAKAIGAVA